MNAITIAMAAMLFATISGAASEEPIPYISIDHPQDGSTVGTRETLLVSAEGWNLRNPMLSIEGENIGVSGPLQGCAFSVPQGGGGSMSMTCKQELNLDSFENQKVKVKVRVNEKSGVLDDTLGLHVSGHCA